MRRLVIAITLLLSALSLAGNAQIFPTVVATVKLTNQTAGIAKTALFTPAADGMFRVNVYLVNTMVSPGVDALWNIGIGWTDDIGTWQYRTVAEVHTEVHNNSVFFQDPVTLTLWAKAGTPINYNVWLKLGPAPGSAYNVYITLEQLM